MRKLRTRPQIAEANYQITALFQSESPRSIPTAIGDVAGRLLRRRFRDYSGQFIAASFKCSPRVVSCADGHPRMIPSSGPQVRLELPRLAWRNTPAAMEKDQLQMQTGKYSREATQAGRLNCSASLNRHGASSGLAPKRVSLEPAPEAFGFLPSIGDRYCFSQTAVCEGSPGELPVSVIVWPSEETAYRAE
jgi:hypothetical protein